MQIHLLTPLICREGGADVYTEMLAAGLSERGHDVTLICQRASESVKRRWRTAVVDLPDYDHWRWLWRVAPYLRWRRWQKFIAALDLPRPDVLISSKGFCSSALVRRFSGAPLIYLPHSRIEPVEIDQMLPPGSEWLQRKLACGISRSGERWSLLHAATTVRFTLGNVADLRAYYRLPERVRFDVIPPGIEGPDMVPEKKPSSTLRLLCVCRLVESKNLHFLIDVLSTIKQSSWRLDIVGDGPERARLQGLVGTHGLQDRIHFHGHRSDPSGFYSEADLHVFPSRLESLGLVVLEAMAYGIPTLAIQADGDRYRNANHELIQHEEDGLLARDKAHFRQLLAACLDHRDIPRTLGENARQTYLAQHQWPAVIDRWESLLNELVPGKAEDAAFIGRCAKATTAEYALARS
jgi:glycosyltransferase involved in cell wall biosynthesis